MQTTTNHQIQIRLATNNDFETIYSIWIEGIQHSFKSSDAKLPVLKEKFADNFQQRHGIFNFWVAVDTEKNICGWQSLIKASNNPFRHNTHAESSTYVSRKHRDKGVGKSLLDYVMMEAEKSHLEYVIAFIANTNEAIKRVVKETGWIEVGSVPASKKNKEAILKTFIVRPV